MFSLAVRADASHYESNPSDATAFDCRIQLRAGLAESSEVGKVFWALAQEEISARGWPRSANWADIELRTIVKAIAEHESPKSEIRRVSLECSSGTASPARRAQIAEDIERLDPVMRIEDIGFPKCPPTICGAWVQSQAASTSRSQSRFSSD